MFKNCNLKKDCLKYLSIGNFLFCGFFLTEFIVKIVDEYKIFTVLVVYILLFILILGVFYNRQIVKEENAFYSWLIIIGLTIGCLFKLLLLFIN